ncbi:rhamnan synthesis F family protein [Burkholderia vietnamiensis]
MTEALRADLDGYREAALYDVGMCRLLAVWYPIAERMNRTDITVIPIRHPSETAESLWLRDGLFRAHALLVWLTSFVSIEYASRGRKRVFLQYDELVGNWRAAAKGLATSMDIVWPRDPERAAPDVDRSVKEMRSNRPLRSQSLNGADTLSSVVERAWKAAILLVANASDPDALQLMDAIREDLGPASELYGSVIIELQAKYARDLASQSRTIRERDSVLADRTTRLVDAEMRFVKLHQRAENREKEISNYESRVAQLTADFSAAERELRYKARELHSMRELVNTLREKHANAGIELEQKNNDFTNTELNKLSAQLQLATANLQKLQQEHQLSVDALRAAEIELDNMRASTSWRVSRPLRSVGRSIPLGPRRIMKNILRAGWRTATPWRNAERRRLAELARTGTLSAVTSADVHSPIKNISGTTCATAMDAPLIKTPQVTVGPDDLHIANLIRDSEFFSAETYDGQAHAREIGMDPALHYVLYGEKQGLMPSDKFDPVYYGERYPDIVAWGGNRLSHYIARGRAEQRYGLPVTDTEILPTNTLNPDKPTVLVIAHEASRTGAPILAWNICRALRARANVVAVLMRGGALEEPFAEVADAVVGPPIADVFNPADGRRFGHRLADTYKPLYVIANSVETRSLVPGLAEYGVPVVALVHEFSGYTKPIGSLQRLYEQAAEIVFPADIVKRSSENDYPALRLRHAHVLPQGPSEVPKSNMSKSSVPLPRKTCSVKEKLRPEEAKNSLLVVGMGFVDWRKGVDLFVSALTALASRAPTVDVRFVWVGHGFKVSDRLDIASYLAEQVERSGIGDRFAFLDAVENVEDIYAEADVLFLSSRLDPLPNVSIDAALRGIPIVCFADASGMAEILMSDEATQELVVAHLDAGAAAIAIGKLATDRNRLKQLGTAVQKLARERFDMEKYVEHLDRLGRSAGIGTKQEREDARLISDANLFDAPIYLGPLTQSTSISTAIEMYVTQSSKIDYSRIPVSGAYTRRPVAGFNPYTYARARMVGSQTNRYGDPYAHYLRQGSPLGPWKHPVLRVEELQHDSAPTNLRVALHAHFHYTDHVENLMHAVLANSHPCRLIITTDTDAKAAEINIITERYGLPADILVLENRGRDIGPFVHVLGEIGDQYDVLGHVHGKRSLSTSNVNVDFGERWRVFLWQHLIGDSTPVMDMIIRAFHEELTLGLVFPEDPHLIGWEENFEVAKDLAKRMQLKSLLPETIDFPVGTMFWARPAAIRRLLALELSPQDYPEEPLPTDGTMLHALERLLPIIVEDAGYHFATTYLPRYVR